MKSNIYIYLALTLFLTTAQSINAQPTPDVSQEEKPTMALLRHRAGNQTIIETIVASKLAEKGTVSVSIYKAEKKVSRKLAENTDLKPCAEPLLPGILCLDESFDHPNNLIFVYPLTTAPEEASKYMVAFSIDDAAKGKIEQIVKVSMDLEEIKPIVENFYRDEKYHTSNGFEKVDFRPNGVIKIPVSFPVPNEPRDKEFDEYIEERIDTIFDYLDPKTVPPIDIANVRVEPQTKDVSPQIYRVLGVRIEPDGRTKAKDLRHINIFLVTDKKFPADKFALEVSFVGNPPAELKGKLLNTIDGIAHLKPEEASKVGSNTTLGLRAFKSNLDLGLALTSSVKNEEENGIPVRRRKNNGVLDVMFAPFYNISLDRDEEHFITPVFIDAKVSTGKISKDTLSLNRILIGTEYNFRWRPNDGNYNKYIFSFRGINASDRDFKRIEGKFNFEFRPLFNKLNNPLTVQYKDPLPPSILIPANGPKYVETGWFGYQIQPFIGFEAGRVYRLKRDAFSNEESDRNIRRLIFGADIVFNVTKFMNIKINDTFYIRGESKDAKNRNYFNGTLEAPIITSRRTAQSLFFSFERGDQPPFVSPSVNVLKIGYRITSNFSSNFSK